MSVVRVDFGNPSRDIQLCVPDLQCQLSARGASLLELFHCARLSRPRPRANNTLESTPLRVRSCPIQRPQPDASEQSFSDVATAAAEPASFQAPAFNDNSSLLLDGQQGADLSAPPSAPLPRVDMQSLAMQSNPLFAALGGAKLEQALPSPPPPPQPQPLLPQPQPPPPPPLTSSASLRLDIGAQSGAEVNRLARVASALRDVEVCFVASLRVPRVGCFPAYFSSSTIGR